MTEPARQPASVQVGRRPTKAQRTLLLRMLGGVTVLEGRELQSVRALQRRGWAEPGPAVLFHWQEDWRLTPDGRLLARRLAASGRIDGKRHGRSPQA